MVKFATDGSLPIAINYTTEHEYDERKVGLKDFALERGTHLPRLGYLAVGDKFTTNCVSSGTGAASFSAVETAVKAGTAIYGGASTDGSIALGTSEPSFGPVLLVVAVTTMPDGQKGIKFQVLKA